MSDDDRVRVGKSFVAISCNKFIAKDVEKCGIHKEDVRDADVLFIEAALKFEGVENSDSGFDFGDGIDQFRSQGGRDSRVLTGCCADRADGAHTVDTICICVIGVIT